LVLVCLPSVSGGGVQYAMRIPSEKDFFAHAVHCFISEVVFHAGSTVKKKIVRAFGELLTFPDICAEL
jgi:hypothetical protein